jgi:hypothetical protein
VPAGGSLPLLTFPFAAMAGYGAALAIATLTNPSDGTINNNSLGIDTPVVQNTSSVDVVATVSDGGVPFTAGQQAAYTARVRNVGTSAATGDVTVHYPAPFAGMTATGTGWTCTDSTVADPTCTHPGGIAAGSSLPPVTITGTVPAQNAPAAVRAPVSVDNASDSFTNDNYASLDTAVTVMYGEYVAMGDSYSSGEGLAPYLDKSGCDRSNQAYGPQLDSALSLGTMTFAACSGAVTQDFFAPNHKYPSEPAQIRQLKTTTTSVTFTIGGNDVGFKSVVEKCLRITILGLHNNGYGCSKDKTFVSQVNSRIAALHGSGTAASPDRTSIIPIQTLLLRIHQLAPHAFIAVAGYPALFGSSSSAYTKSNSAPSKYMCQVGSGGSIDYQDAQWLNSEAVSLDNAIYSAVVTAQAQGVPVRYVDTVPTNFATHGLCDSGSAWINGVSGTAPGNFHPTGTGQSNGYEAAFSGLPSF